MKILIRQFLGKNHSWAVCGWGIARALKKAGHTVHLFSTDGIKHLPDDLKENIVGFIEENKPDNVFGRSPDASYDAQFSYTCMKNFSHFLSSGNKNRFGIWCYEWAGHNVLPDGFAKSYKDCDFLCAPSNFAKRVFLESKIPEQSIKVIPHGIDSDQYSQNSTLKLPTNKSFKILVNVAQNHLRKNIPGLLEAYGKAFSNKDDVALILKGSNKPVNLQFEISLKDCLDNFYKKYPRHAEVKLFTDFIPDVSILYRSVDATFTLAHTEGFFFPALESIASGKLVIAPKWGGHLDFLNDSNSLLVSGKEARANPKSMYWESKPNAIWFDPSIDDAVLKLRFAFSNFKEINQKVENDRPNILKEYSWDNIIQRFLSLCS